MVTTPFGCRSAKRSHGKAENNSSIAWDAVDDRPVRRRGLKNRSRPTGRYLRSGTARAYDDLRALLFAGNPGLRLVLLSRTRKKGSQFSAVVLPPLVMPRFKHCECTILDVRIRQCRDEVLSLPFVLIIHFLQDGLKGPHERMILDNCRLCSLTNHSLLPGNTALQPLVWENKCGVCRKNDRSDEFNALWRIFPHNASSLDKVC